MRRTKGIISEGAVLCLNYAVVLVPAVALQAATAGFDALASSVEALDVRQWALLFAFSLGVYLGANLAQQLAIRQLGPALVSSLMPSRLLSSAAGSTACSARGARRPSRASASSSSRCRRPSTWGGRFARRAAG